MSAQDAGWRCVQGRRVLVHQQRPTSPDDGTVTAFRDGVVTLRSNRRTSGFTEAVQEIGYQGVNPGDLVVHSMDAFAGAIGVSDSRGKMSPVVHVYQVTPAGDSRFIAYQLRAQAWSGRIESLAKGIRERSTSFDRGTLASLILQLPSAAEQRRIADFLDDQVSRIDDAIASRDLQATLVSERWAASLGLAFSAEGRVDLMQPLKRVAWWREGPGILAQDFTETGTPLLRIANVRGGHFTMNGCGYVDSVMARTRWRHLAVREGELLTSGSASSGLAVEVPREADGAIPYTGLIRVRPLSEAIRRDYLRFFLLSPAFLEQVNALKTGIAIQHWGPYHLAQVNVVVPDRESQESVSLRLKAEQTWREDALKAIASSRRLLEERKRALITAAITGEFDVSSAGPRAVTAVMS
jgi:type I restriction enzyme, S subunit